jgi:predicted permease
MSWTRFFRRRHWDEERARELEAYLETETDENIARGMSPEEARYAAHRKLGNTTLIREEIYQMNSFSWLETFWQDLRYGARMLAKNPAFTVVAVLTLALGIGANTAIFSIANVFLFRPLPVKDAERLTVVAVQSKADSDPSPMSYLDYQEYRGGTTAVFAGVTGYAMSIIGLSYQGHADRLLVSYVPSNFFAMLGIRPELGRLINPGEGDAPKTGPVVVLGNSYWKRRFGGDPNVIGRTVALDGNAVTVIGVVPEEFRGPYSLVEMDAYAPLGVLGFDPDTVFFTSRAARDMRMLASLKPGVSIKQAQAALNAIGQRLAEQYPQADQGQRVRVFPERIARPEPAVADYMPLIAGIFFVMVALVLVVACLNVANLLLARAAAREREISIRAALGAGRKRLLRQLLTESMLLALAGGVGGALAGNWVCHLSNGLRPLGDLPMRLAFVFDWRVFAYVAGVALAAGVLAGLVPAVRVLRADLNSVLREGGRGLIGEGGRHWLRNGLVIAQVAGSLVVLVAAGLFTRSLTRAESIDLGFNPHNVLNVGFDPELQGYDQARAEAFFRDLLDRTRALPGVQSASLAFSVPLGIYNDSAQVYPEGQTLPPSERVSGALFNPISPGYFATLGMHIVEGRAITEADTAASPPVAVINKTMAARLWPHRDPIGQRFSYKSPSGPYVTVVGLVRDAKSTGLLDAPGMYFYVPETQNYKSIHVLQVRTSVPPESLEASVNTLVRTLDPNMPMYEVMTMDQALEGANGYFLFKMGAAFTGTLGALGLLLAVVGVYGVVSFTAGRRRHEIGIRMALGAQRGSVFGLVIRQAATLVCTGVGIGVIAALACTRILGSLLVGVSSYDPVTYAGVAALLLAAALLACYIPARRAMKVDPLVALHYE